MLIDYKSRVENMAKVERDSLEALEKQGRDQINSYDRFKNELEGLVTKVKEDNSSNLKAFKDMRAEEEDSRRNFFSKADSLQVI